MPLSAEGDHKPRLCTLRKWDNFPGYGFNLQAEKGKPGQFIGYVDAESPADACGLRKNDRVIEVNGVNVCNESHKQVVARIRENPDEVSLLVMDPATEKYFLENGIVVKGSMDVVEKRHSTPNGVTPTISEAEPSPLPATLPGEQTDDIQEEPTAEENVPVAEATVEHEEVELVKETEELNLQETTEEVLPEKVEQVEHLKVEQEEHEKHEVPKEEEVEKEVAEVELSSPAEASANTQAEDVTITTEEEIKTDTASSEDHHETYDVPPVSNSGDTEDSMPTVNNDTEATSASVTKSEVAISEPISNSMNGNGTHSNDPMSIYQRPASEVRAMHGRSKRRAIKETNQTFKEKYLMFESL